MSTLKRVVYKDGWIITKTESELRRSKDVSVDHPPSTLIHC